MDFIEKGQSPNPLEKSSLISKLFFAWLFPLFSNRGKPLEIGDLYKILGEDDATLLGNKLEAFWKSELEIGKLKERKPRLSKALIRLSWKTLAGFTLVFMINQCVIYVSQPIFLRLLILTFNQKVSEQWKSWVYAGSLTLAVLLNTLTNHPAAFKLHHLGMKLRVATSALIYRKALKLSRTSQQQTSSGQIVNLLCNDCNRFATTLNLIPFIATAPIVFCIMLFLLYDQIGLSSLSGVGFIILVIPVQYLIGKFSATLRLNISQRTDERGKLMNEIIVGMRVIKQYVWEKPFATLIGGIRKLELVEIKGRGYLRGFHAAVICFSPKLVQFITFATFLLVKDEPLSADKVFFTIACLHIVCMTLVHYTPAAAAAVGELTASLKRIEDFLLLEEQAMNKQKGLDGNQILVENVKASWTGKKETLDSVSFALEPNKLMIIVGQVGSSKTSLLQAIINELPISTGSVSVKGTISYACQEPWIFPGNVRQNILFGIEYEEERYNEVVKACALEEDFNELPFGDQTLVGERGVALSGGQKARVNLARAVYRKADVYLMDDPLSAVDSKVGGDIFRKCIMERLGSSTRILATHQLQYLPQADHILVLNEGKVVAQGNYGELIKNGIDFDGITKSFKLSQERSAQPEVQIKNRKGPDKNEETKSIGSVTGMTYLEYFLSGHSILEFVLLLLTFIVTQFLMSGTDWWLSFWTNAEKRKVFTDENVYLYIYSGLVFTVIIFNCLRSLWFYKYCVKISGNIHKKMFTSIVNARVRFFDKNPSGRIMNRFTKDLGVIDELLPFSFCETLIISLQIVGAVVIVTISNYFMAGPAILLFMALYLVRLGFIGISRDLKRIEAVTGSPVYTHVSTTLQGLATIRARKSQKLVNSQFELLQNIHNSAWFLYMAVNRAFAMWLELISDIFLGIVTFSFLILSSSDKGGNVGLAISSLLSLTGVFQWGMRQSAETENFMTSVERALEYSKLEPEEVNCKANVTLPSNWPDKGEIEFKNVSLSYESDKIVLDKLCFMIGASEKVGIIGRTGAGKSSVIAALFRMTEPDGDILIDGVNVKLIGLGELRKRISIIPQDPTLFSGTVRYNLDPLGEFSDIDLWNVLEQVELKEAVPSLDFKVEDSGLNFSVGQRQLICLGRAMLRKNKIIVIDEATANIDYNTDNLIQETIRRNFSNCTILTIAHRLQSVIDYDRILVMDGGTIQEDDEPRNLIERKHF